MRRTATKWSITPAALSSIQLIGGIEPATNGFHSEGRSARNRRESAPTKMHENRKTPPAAQCKFSAVINSARHSCTRL